MWNIDWDWKVYIKCVTFASNVLPAPDIINNAINEIPYIEKRWISYDGFNAPIHSLFTLNIGNILVNIKKSLSWYKRWDIFFWSAAWFCWSQKFYNWITETKKEGLYEKIWTTNNLIYRNMHVLRKSFVLSIGMYKKNHKSLSHYYHLSYNLTCVGRRHFSCKRLNIAFYKNYFFFPCMKCHKWLNFLVKRKRLISLVRLRCKQNFAD